MKFLCYFEVKPEKRDENIARFKAIGTGVIEGVRLESLLFDVTMLEGWAVAEADDPSTLARYLKNWTDLNINHIAPVLTADQVAEIYS